MYISMICRTTMSQCYSVLQSSKCLTAGSRSWTLTPGTSGTGLVLPGLSVLPPGRNPISSHAAGWGHGCSKKNRTKLDRMKQKRVVCCLLVSTPRATESRGQNVRTHSTFVNANVLIWDEIQTDSYLPIQDNKSSSAPRPLRSTWPWSEALLAPGQLSAHMAAPASPCLQVPEGSVITDPGVGGLCGRHKGVVFHELLCVAHQTVGHFRNFHTVSVQLDVQERNLMERERQ